jgi:hypothetical protein
METLEQRPGFALPMAVLLLLVTTGAVMVTLTQESTERRVLDSETAGLEALVLAESGLERVAVQSRNWTWEGTNGPFPRTDSAYVRLTGLGSEIGIEGFAEVIVNRLWENATGDTALYLVRSRGVRTRGGWGGAPEAVRTVTRIARWQATTMDVPSAWTSLGGLRKNGAAGSLDGNDGCGEEPAKAGVAVPLDPGYTGHETPLHGDPPLLHIGADPQEAGDAINIDWATILAGTPEPDYYVPATPWEEINFDTWPIIYVTEPAFSLPNTGGRGILIAPGNLTISGDNVWQGVVLVGNKLTSNGNNTVSGATVSGLNVKLGMAVDESDVGNGTKTFEYNSCDVAQAMDSFGGGLQPMENTWLDSWRGY